MNTPNQSNLPAVLNEDEAAAMLKVTPRCLRSLRAKRLVPYIKLGRFVRFEQSAIEAAIKQLTVTAKLP